MATPPEKNTAGAAAAQPAQPAAATEKVPPTVPASLAERLLDALQKTVTAGSSTPAEGKITTDEKSRYLAELAAYKCLNDQADAISGQVNHLGLRNARIRMIDSMNVVGDDLLLQQMLAEFSYWQHTFADRLNALQLQLPHGKSTRGKSSVVASVAGTTIVAGLLGVLPSIISLFRSDLELKGQQVTTPSRTALQLRVAHGIHGAIVLMPQMRQVTDCTLLQSLLETETKRRDFSRPSSCR